MSCKLTGKISFVGGFQTRTKILTWIADFNSVDGSHSNIEICKVGEVAISIGITADEMVGIERQFNALYTFLETLPKFRDFEYECWQRVSVERIAY